jgi:Tfp pilus assembly protein PilW
MTIRLTPRAGFTIVEMLVATMIMMAVTGAVFALMNPAQGTFQAQPEVSDMQQRMRVGVDTLTKDVIMAGAGTYMGANTGALYNFFAPIQPYRIGDVGDDRAAGVFYRADTISLMYVPPTPSQTGVVKAEGNNSQELVVTPQANCGTDVKNQLCGFHKDNMRVLIYEPTGAWDMTTITNAQDPAKHLQHTGKLSSTYSTGNAQITEVAAHTYYLKADATTHTYQLMHYDTAQADVPVVDNVVSLKFEYYGDPQPPQLVPGKTLCDAAAIGPFTTYGPKPPCLGVDGPGSYGLGENCTFKVTNGMTVPRLNVLDAGAGQVEITQAMMTDGPWCPDSDSANRDHAFDADLLRIRRVHVTLRVQAALEKLRGPAGILFKHGGTSTTGERYVPDQEIRFDITPRNMNLGR